MSWKWPLFGVVTIVAGLAVWMAFRLDMPIREKIVASQGPGWKKSAEHRFHSTVRKLGDWPPLMAAAAVALAVARWRRNRKWMRILAAAMIASTVAGVLANASRLTTGRTRPRESPRIEQGFYGPWHEGKVTIGNSGFNSFPSGHTATAVGFAVVILLGAPLWGAVAIAGAGLVIWSSLAIGAHHPSDIVVSVFLASGVACIVWQWMGRTGGVMVDRIFRLPEA